MRRFDIYRSKVKTLYNPEPECAEQAYGKDTRYRIEDTQKYPYMAIGFISIDCYEFVGTGFLCKGNVFYTAAHNIIHRKSRAKDVSISFGLNGETNFKETKIISLEGSAFTIPDEYEVPMDQYDIAWVNLQDYYDNNKNERNKLSWCMDDLPKQFFYTCDIPENPGPIRRTFQICGK